MSLVTGPMIQMKYRAILSQTLTWLEQETGYFYSMTLTQAGAKPDLVLKPLEYRLVKVTMRPDYSVLNGYYQSIGAVYERVDQIRFNGLIVNHSSQEPIIWQCPQCQQTANSKKQMNTVASAICRHCGYYHTTHWDGIIASIHSGEITCPQVTYPYISEERCIIGSIQIQPHMI